jgi:hypothetical protein
MRRLGCSTAAIEFYAEQIEADAVHEQLVRYGVIALLFAAEPERAAGVMFGIPASTLLAAGFPSCCGNGPRTGSAALSPSRHPRWYSDRGA